MVIKIVSDAPVRNKTIGKAVSKFNPYFLKIAVVGMDHVLRSPHLLQTCRNLSLGGGNPESYSGMNLFLKRYSALVEKQSINARGIFAHYHDVPVGWLLLTYVDDAFSFRARTGEACTQIYVRESWRRLGIGSRLQHTAAELAAPNKVRVYEWDNPDFFKKVKEKSGNLINIHS